MLTKLHLISLAIGVAVSLLFQALFPSKQDELKEEEIDPKFGEINFMYWEKSTGLHIPSISTISFYLGEVNVEKVISAKLVHIMERNPWLTSRLVLRYSQKDKKKILVGKYLKTFAKDSVKDYYQIITIDNSKLPESERLSETSSMETIMKIVNPLLVKKGVDCFNTNDILFKAIFIKIIEADSVDSSVTKCVKTAFVLSLSHVLGDGHTFYRLYSMFNFTSHITSLNPDRIFSYPEDLTKVQPNEFQNYLQSVPVILTVLKNLLFGKKPDYLIFRINKNEIEQQKKAFQSEKDKKQPFLSTNDILSSWFFKEVNSLFGFIAINCRNRLKSLPSLNNDHVGNYETFILYSDKDFEKPDHLRASYQTLVSTSKAYPTFFQTMENRLAGISNWASFYTQVHLSNPDDHTHPMLLHLPLFHQNDSALTDFMFIFQANAQETGVLIFSRTRNNFDEWLQRNSSLLLPLQKK